MKIKNKEIILICRKMNILLNSGYEITNSMYLINEQFSKKTSQLITQIANSIQNGHTITEAFQRTGVFSQFFIGMLMVGEVSGNIDEVMYDLSKYYDKEEKIKTKIISIATYPIILMIVSFITMVFILIYVIPSYEMVFMNSNMEMPLLTTILIYTSRFIREKSIYVVVILFVLILAIAMLVSAKGKIKYFKDKIKVKLPLVRDFVLLIYTTRFCKTLKLLIKSGVHIIDAIEISSRVVSNQFVYEKLLISREYIQQGNSIYSSIKKANVFPKLFISMIKIGEESGGLEEALSSMDDYYSQELDFKVERIINVGGPMLTVIIGLFVGGFIMAMILPIFDAVSAI